MAILVHIRRARDEHHKPVSKGEGVESDGIPRVRCVICEEVITLIDDSSRGPRGLRAKF